MSAKKFKFVSPGVFLNEVDQSQLPRLANNVGPVIIGRTQRGPAFRPTRVDSFSDFIEVFGEPVPGGGSERDQFRSGVPQGPTYASYAAQAYLRNNSPVTVVRILGSEHPNKDTSVATSNAGYRVGDYTAATTAAKTHTDGGAFGLFVFPSSSTTVANAGVRGVTGTLGAIFYAKNGSIEMTGTIRGKDNLGDVNGSGTCVIMKNDSNKGFSVLVKTSAQAATATSSGFKKFNFTFNPDDDKFIRKVFNTDPTLVNSGVTTSDAQENYYLGQTFERSVFEMLNKDSDGTTNDMMGVILPLHNGTNSADNFRMASRAAQSGWVFSQDMRNTIGDKSESSNNAQSFTLEGDAADVTKLFKFHGLSEGEWIQRNLKISIDRIQSPSDNFNKYGTFSVVIRKMEDNDKAIKIVERFDNLSLNPNSPDYISRRIGDIFEVYDHDRKRLQAHGTYPNQSKFIRVEMNQIVDSGQTDPELLPFGFYGPIVYGDFTIQTPNAGGANAPTGDQITDAYKDASDSTHQFARLSGSTSVVTAGDDDVVINSYHTGSANDVAARANNSGMNDALDVKVEFPSHRLVSDSSEFGLSDHRAIYFGIDTTKSGSSQTAFDETNIDYAHPLGADFAASLEADSSTTTAYAFTLDNLSASSNATDSTANLYDRFYYVSGSRADGDSISAASGTYKSVLKAFKDVGGARFTMPLFGGFNGLDVREKEPFNHTRQLTSTSTELNSYAFYSLKKGLDMISDPEYVEMNIAALPGIVNEDLTKQLIDVCEERADALAIIDPKGGYTPNTENTDSEQTRTKTTAAKEVVDNLIARNINSSYGAAYFPWVQIRDGLRGNLLYVPPSVVALGILGASETKSAVWFAPAGFNRGGLTESGSGLSVTGVRHKLTSGERDRLYEANINPIASFPSEGIVVFGQKTLQVTPSALDRINVRRLMIFVKRGISRIASSTLFEQNLESTWTRFKTRADNFLGGVQAGLGLEEFKVVLDRSTTTADLIDRNIMYAKIFVKPAKAIEFIAIDFVVTRSGASFED
jgi:hypothetical protein